MSPPTKVPLPDPRITIEVRRYVEGQWLVARQQLELRDWLLSFQPSGMADKLIHEALGEIGWRP